MRLGERCERIELILSDVDGVLTDGQVIFDNQGIETKQFQPTGPAESRPISETTFPTPRRFARSAWASHPPTPPTKSAAPPTTQQVSPAAAAPSAKQSN